MNKFVKGEINIILTTNILARGTDVPETTLVINFDVPRINADRKLVAEEIYMGRVKKAGKMGVLTGIALTIYDNQIDEKKFNEIVDYYHLKNKVLPLDSGDHLRKLI